MYNERIDNLRCFRTGIQILNLDKIRLFLYFPIICLELFTTIENKYALGPYRTREYKWFSQ